MLGEVGCSGEEETVVSVCQRLARGNDAASGDDRTTADAEFAAAVQEADDVSPDDADEARIVEAVGRYYGEDRPAEEDGPFIEDDGPFIQGYCQSLGVPIFRG